MTLANLAIAKDVAQFHQTIHQLDTAIVIPGQVITIGKVERIDVPVIGLVAFLDNL